MFGLHATLLMSLSGPLPTVLAFHDFAWSAKSHVAEFVMFAHYDQAEHHMRISRCNTY